MQLPKPCATRRIRTVLEAVFGPHDMSQNNRPNDIFRVNPTHTCGIWSRPASVPITGHLPQKINRPASQHAAMSVERPPPPRSMSVVAREQERGHESRIPIVHVLEQEL